MFPLAPLPGGGASAVDIGDNIPYSCMLDSSLSQYFSRTIAAGTSRTLWEASAYVKRGKQGVAQLIFGAGNFGGGSSPFTYMRFGVDDLLYWYDYNGSAYSVQMNSTAPFRDPTAIYHIRFVFDSGNATATERARIYVNHERIAVSYTVTTNGAQSVAWNNSAFTQWIGASVGWAGAGYGDYYLSDVILLSGQNRAETDFYRVSADTGVKVHKTYTGGYGAYDTHLEFKDPSFATYGLGKDTSGNNNHWTPQGGISSANQYTDTPTNNYAVLNTLSTYGPCLTFKGNTKFTTPGANYKILSTLLVPSTGVWYWEVTATAVANIAFGIAKTLLGNNLGYNPGECAYNQYNGAIYLNGTPVQTGLTAPSNNDVFGLVLNSFAKTLQFYRNDTAYGTAVDISSIAEWIPAFGTIYSGGEGVFNSGGRPFTYDSRRVSAGAKALNTANLPTPAITKPALHFQALLDTGANIKTNLAALFTYYLDWIKDRANSNNHQLIDTVRGSTAVLQSNTTAAETTYTAPSGSSVGWAWNMGGAPVTNNNGSISSQVSANQLAGQSVVTYTGTGVNATVGHGLSKAPELVIQHARNATVARSWRIWHKDLTSGAYCVYFDTSVQTSDPTSFNSTAPSSTVVSLGTHDATNESGKSNVIYCFHSVEGYSKFTSAVMNGTTDNAYVALGFKAALVIGKRIDAAASWQVLDNRRSPDNPANEVLFLDTNGVEATSGWDIDVDAFGIKFRVANSGTWIVCAWAEAPQKYSTAR